MKQTNLKGRLFLDIHAIQTLPPSNINRDDTGAPKTAQYGGVRRSRVSSQSWKRAIRDYFYENADIKNVGVRTLNIVDYLADKITGLDGSIEREEALKLAKDTFKLAGVTTTKENKAKALFFLSNQQAEKLAQASVEGVKDKKILKSYLNENPSMDIALFGRMVADDPTLNEDASSQVAHAISTHGVQTEFDFFTAIDDLSDENNAGAGMLGTIEFNSSTIYRYANIALHELIRQLGDKEATIKASKLFIEAFSNSLPTGKINTFANQTLPQLIFLVIRSDRPVNLVSAFEEPVRSKEGYVEESIIKLFDEYEKAKKFTKDEEFAIYLSLDKYEDKTSVHSSENIKTLLKEYDENIRVSIENNLGE